MNNKKINIIVLLLSCIVSFAQTTISEGLYNHNGGVIQIHDDAQLGIHTHLVNDGTFDENLGLTGFYSPTEVLTVSGTNRAIFNNLEVGVLSNLVLETSLALTNEFYFIAGKIITPRDNPDVSLDFIDHDFYDDESDERHVDGYVTITETANKFTFPVGDGEYLRPMKIPQQNKFIAFEGAYFSEHPDSPSTFEDSFTTTIKDFKVETVSEKEFWDLNGAASTRITLTWNSNSNISLITPSLNALIVVGWSKANNQWEDLGNFEMSGDIEEGEITSQFFVPNEYEIITLGSVGKITNNYNISPNGDNLTDTLVFEELETGIYPYSELVIFNRWGTKVYFRKNYQNDFDGISEAKVNLNKKNKLPDGTYFYELKYGATEELNEFKTGWVYINR